jgi:uncharacterized Zn finger protein
MSRLDIAAIRSAVGEKAFARGEGYAASGAAEIYSVDEARILARAFGTEVYRVELSWRAKGFAGRCTCPAYAEAGVCKHMVAVALLAEAADEAQLAQARDRLARVRERLMTLDRREIVDLVLTAAMIEPWVLEQIDDEYREGDEDFGDD